MCPHSHTQVHGDTHVMTLTETYYMTTMGDRDCVHTVTHRYTVTHTS